MKIRSLETFKITLPFRFSFGHSLASRSESQNLLVKITLDNGITGWGEGVPRDYVTGETIDNAEENVLLRYSPEIIGLRLDNPFELIKNLKSAFERLGLRKTANGASWCAVELAIMDAASKLVSKPVYALLGEQKQKSIRYGGVVPFGKKKALNAVLWFYKLYGFQTVKIKVGAEDLQEDVEKLRIARSVMGDKCILRVDANCAWTVEQTMRASELFKPFNISSIEQPLPADDWDGLQKLSKEISEDILVDESLCTLEQAEQLAKDKICNAFNIRISKAGGLLAAQEMVEIAKANGLRIHLGAQVGESAILSAAARHFASTYDPFENYEGSANGFLLKKDICKENLTAGLGGQGSFSYARKNFGLGINVQDNFVLSFVDTNNSNNSEEQRVNRVDHKSNPLSHTR
ncbi:MAG: dipeptide epimerase [Candidatus Obscuribacterales bacterium]|jgi:muconate cycloisomerase|nr:dipeptide epimerase [Candidatus Obscuribacterales bacterium]